jgi:hypothetical protein
MADNDYTLTPERADLLKNAEALLGDPETRSAFLGLVKKKNPGMVIPEHDVKSQIEIAMSAERAAREKLEQEMRDERTRNEIEKRRLALAGRGVDVAEVEKIMVEKGITSHDTAADFILQSRQIAGGSAGPGTAKPSPISPMKEAKEQFNGDIKAWGRAKALEDLQAFKSGVRH